MIKVDLYKFDLTLRLFNRTLSELIYKPVSNKKNGLTNVQRNCLRFIYCHKNPSAKEVAEGLQISNAAVTKLIDRLEKKRLVVRKFSQNDRRQIILELTPEGLKIYEQERESLLQSLQEIINRLDPETLKNLKQGIQGFLEAALVKKEDIDRICLHCGWFHLPDCPGNLRYRSLTGEDKKEI